MDFDKLQDFFLWNLLINIIIYFISLIAVFSLRGLMYKVHAKLFGVSEEAISKVVYLYFGIYKIFIIFFSLAPWIAIQIIK